MNHQFSEKFAGDFATTLSTHHDAALAKIQRGLSAAHSRDFAAMKTHTTAGDSRSAIISADEIRRVIHESPLFTHEMHITLADAQYESPSQQEMATFLAQMKPSYDNLVYRPEVFDCDDFALKFAVDARTWWAERANTASGISVGVIHGVFEKKVGCHAINVWIDAQKKMRFIEPQNCEFLFPEKNAISWFFYM
ncbi:MAG: lectin MOA-related protein [Methylomonas sp.]|jgi:hypothetical protein|uniref:lectin MOA-related protein n=1 Tax=Methylomonas sp. TaxID=418 RepID=UPI0025EB8741|nr:lectin MOA-related protein [Methylomonas sp.]MCK9608158.1 lectin MOA-related protein [Methylomonas sp.]